MEPYWVSLITGIIMGWGSHSSPDPGGIYTALIYRSKWGGVLLEILHYQFLLALALVVLEIALLPVRWYLTALCLFCGVNLFVLFRRFCRRISNYSWENIELVFDSPFAAILSFLAIISLSVFVITKWWGK